MDHWDSWAMHFRNCFTRVRWVATFFFYVAKSLLESIILGETFGENLEIVGEILEQALNTEADPESRLRTFMALSTSLQLKDVIFKNSVNLNVFLEKLITGNSENL